MDIISFPNINHIIININNTVIKKLFIKNEIYLYLFLYLKYILLN